MGNRFEDNNKSTCVQRYYCIITIYRNYHTEKSFLTYKGLFLWWSKMVHFWLVESGGLPWEYISGVKLLSPIDFQIWIFIFGNYTRMMFFLLLYHLQSSAYFGYAFWNLLPYWDIFFHSSTFANPFILYTKWDSSVILPAHKHTDRDENIHYTHTNRDENIHCNHIVTSDSLCTSEIF